MTQPPPYPGDLGPTPQQLPPYDQQPPPQRAPGVPSYARPPRQPTSANGLAVATIVAAVVVAVFTVIELGLAWMARDDYLEAADRGIGGYDVWTAFDTAGMIGFLLLIPVYVISCIWLFQARVNTEAFAPWARHALSRGWAWGSWVCPVVNFWFPFQFVRDVLRPAGHRRSALLGWWWALWLVGATTTGIGSMLLATEELVVSAINAMPIVQTVHTVAYVAAAVLWIRIVQFIRSDQNRAFAANRTA